jgi:hypothetical protein
MFMILNTQNEIINTLEIYIKGLEKVYQKRNEFENCLILDNYCLFILVNSHLSC